MKINFFFTGKLRKSPELELFEKYRFRFDKLGRNLHLGPVTVFEEDSKKNAKTFKNLFSSSVQRDRAYNILLDEKGEKYDSLEFANFLMKLRDDGTICLSFLVGGADGSKTEAIHSSDKLLSFGSMVWPHMLVRVMLIEQLYRCATIISGLPYHRN